MNRSEARPLLRRALADLTEWAGITLNDEERSWALNAVLDLCVDSGVVDPNPPAPTVPYLDDVTVAESLTQAEAIEKLHWMVQNMAVLVEAYVPNNDGTEAQDLLVLMRSPLWLALMAKATAAPEPAPEPAPEIIPEPTPEPIPEPTPEPLP